MMKKYEILVTNDDGFESKALLELVSALKKLDNVHVCVVAPANEKSACGHSLTLTRPLRFIDIDDDFYKLDDGTPSDCVYLSLFSIYGEDKKPDLVISGINKGSNMGEDITYSGTASAAMEAVLHGIPAFAISQVMDFTAPLVDYTLAIKTALDITEKILKKKFPLSSREFLNINIPIDKKDADIKVTYAGYRHYINDAHLHRNPRGEEYYRLGLHPLSFESRNTTTKFLSDFEAIQEGYISITPIQLDMSAYHNMQKLQEWL